MFSMLRRRHQSSEISIGARYFRRDAPSIVWEVLSLHVGVDGLPHAILYDISHPTLRKTLSQFALESSRQYTRVADVPPAVGDVHSRTSWASGRHVRHAPGLSAQPAESVRRCRQSRSARSRSA